MANTNWPRPGDLGRLLLVYLIAALAAAFVTLVVLVVVYQSKEGTAFLAGMVTGLAAGGLAGYLGWRGFLSALLGRTRNATLHAKPIFRI